MALVSFLSAQGLFVNKTRAITASANFTTVVFVVHGCYVTLRALMMLAGAPIDQFDVPTLFNAAGYMDALIVGILITFGLIIMINQRLNAEVREAKEHFELIFNTGPDASLITRLNDGIIVNINDGFTALTGFTHDETIGRSSLDIHIWKNPADRQKIIDDLGKKGFCENVEAIFLRKDGSQVIGMLSAKRITLQGIPHIISITRDITERKQYQEHLEYFAVHDPLTGLLNRHSLEDILNRTIAKAKRGVMSSLLYMDLDNFKDVNDTVGHAAGDEVLISLSGFLKAELRTEDVAFRLGGDEFAVLLDGIDIREALPAAERLRSFVEAHPFELRGRIFPLSLSIGIIEVNGTLAPEELLSQADAAMYRAKEQGKNRVVVS